MTPEERAEQLVQLIARGDAAFDKRGWIEMPKADRNRYITRSSEHLEAIAQAIRDAEDAALERAAEAIGEGMWVPENPNPLSLSSFCSAKWQGMAPDKMIETVRSLKSKEI